MKLFLAILVMVLAVIGLVLILKPPGKKTRRLASGKKTARRSAAIPPASTKVPSPPKGEKPQKKKSEPTTEEIRMAVRKFANDFPTQTASLLQQWSKKKD